MKAVKMYYYIVFGLGALIFLHQTLINMPTVVTPLFTLRVVVLALIFVGCLVFGIITFRKPRK